MKTNLRILSLILAIILLPLLSGCAYLADRMQGVTDTVTEQEEETEDPSTDVSDLPSLYGKLTDGTVKTGVPAPVPEGTEPDFAVGGARISFVPAAEHEKWRAPLIRLISSAPSPENPTPTAAEDSPSLPYSRGYGLFDVTMDGTPELLSLVSGLGSTTGYAAIEVYDLYTGAKLGTLEKGLHEELAFYYSTDDQSLCAFAYSFLREGYAERAQTVSVLACDANGSYYTPEYLRAEYYYDVLPVGTSSDSDGESILVPSKETYRIYGKELIPQYFAFQYEWFAETMLCIPETRAHLLIWEEVDGEGDSAERAQAMADALLALDQEFVCFESLKK